MLGRCKIKAGLASALSLGLVGRLTAEAVRLSESEAEYILHGSQRFHTSINV